MASKKDIGFENYCDRVYKELSAMKSRLLGFVHEIEDMKTSDKALLETHLAHLNDIVRTLDWKLEILTRVCPFDWEGYADVERTASVKVDEAFSEKDPIAAGYLGG
ncbi:MAG TPA: hypothetical protein VEI96_01600 [Thermodesulfovibrionales bacterium]|nr:hypothetical protein [Thermodesulfovibrionales bacterium]